MEKGQQKNKAVDAKKYVIFQQVSNFIGILFTTPILAAVVFISFDRGVGDLLPVQGFVFFFIFCFMMIQCLGAVNNTRLDYLRAKWKMAAVPVKEIRFIKNPWRLTLPFSIVAGLITAAMVAGIVPKFSQEPFHFLNINFLAGIPLFAVSAILIGIILPRDQPAYAAALAGRKMPAVPFRRYLSVEHILPWALLQGIINFTIGWKQFYNEAHKIGGDIPVLTLAIDSGIVAVIIVFFMWLSSQVQVRPDVHLGRVPEDKRKAPAVPSILLIVLGFLAVGAVVWAPMALAGISTIPPLSAACLKAGVAMASVVPGCWLGVWWGKRREAALIKAK
jgi:hypothetical protein